MRFGVHLGYQTPNRRDMHPMNVRFLAASAAALTFLFAGAASAAEIGEISADDYYGAKYFETALEHPKIAKQKSRARQIKMVARDIGWNKKKLTKAIDKVDSLAGNATDLAKKAIESGFKGTRVDGRVLDVLINDEEPKHVVVYIRFQGTKSAEVVKDASQIAAVVAKKAPLISTLSISAIHPKAPKTSTKSVWSAKISATSMSRIQEKRIEDYADRLYGRMFEEVKSLPF
jgi:hypothetical protein